ncbi:hypothetical protein [Nonomuraea jabiensis]|uniref:hypothetical protein n=1 Tax=Nonomuraea jabiensis TaxID=882448 RepID=UPI0036B795DD
MYDALDVKQSHLPALRVVRAIVTMCTDDAEQVERWLDVWRAINMAEYQRANPPPPGLGRDPPSGRSLGRGLAFSPGQGQTPSPTLGMLTDLDHHDTHIKH